MNCPTCGTAMLHYENPDRDMCPRAHEHGKIAREAQAGRKHAKTGGKSRWASGGKKEDKKKR